MSFIWYFSFAPCSLAASRFRICVCVCFSVTCQHSRAIHIDLDQVKLTWTAIYFVRIFIFWTPKPTFKSTFSFFTLFLDHLSKLDAHFEWPTLYGLMKRIFIIHLLSNSILFEDFHTKKTRELSFEGMRWLRMKLKKFIYSLNKRKSKFMHRMQSTSF